jgi:lipopolysaccharide/colanic/teichoic acid biosynthesis glycosyltransferase
MSTNAVYPPLKRAIDLAASATALVALAPLLALTAVSVRLTSPGPVLFRQERLGRGGRPFQVLKFRTMTSGLDGPAITAAGDKRVTHVGRWLRRYKLDELPQLLNVLRGDMSLVGPRPEVRRYVEMFASEYERILTVRPGITDLAAIEYRHEEEILAASDDPERTYVERILPAKISLYNTYIETMSLATDVNITLATLVALVH